MNRSNEEARTNLWINLMDMPAYRVAYKRVVGPYGLKNNEVVFKKLFKWAYLQFNTDKIMALGIIWDNPGVTVPEQCRYDACITVPMSLLVSTALVVSFMAVRGELMGMRSSGIPAQRGMLPVLLISALARS